MSIRIGAPSDALCPVGRYLAQDGTAKPPTTNISASYLSATTRDYFAQHLSGADNKTTGEYLANKWQTSLRCIQVELSSGGGGGEAVGRLHLHGAFWPSVLCLWLEARSSKLEVRSSELGARSSDRIERN